MKLLAFAGSARTESLNKKLAQYACRLMQEAGVEATFVDLKDYPLPIYDGDYEDEQGQPENAKQLCDIMKNHQGWLIACPEYNSSITPLLKNTIDWISRKQENDPPLVAFRGKIVALVSTSPGALGGLRGLVHVRSILGNIGMHVIPSQLAMPSGNDQFDDTGTLQEESTNNKLKRVVEDLINTTRKLHGE